LFTNRSEVESQDFSRDETYLDTSDLETLQEVVFNIRKVRMQWE
jgi:hypothetical protein